MRACGVIYLFVVIIIIIFYNGHFELCYQEWGGPGTENLRKGVGNEVGRLGVRALGEIGKLRNSGKIRSERLRRFSFPDFAPASHNLNGPSESIILRVDKLSLYSLVIILLTVRAPCAKKSPKSIFSSLSPMIHHSRPGLEPPPSPPPPVAWENSRHLATLPLVSPSNDVWETSAEIPYWWRVTTQIWVELLIGWIKFPTQHDQSQTPSRYPVFNSFLY